MNQIKLKNILIAVSNKPSIDVLLPILAKYAVKIWATEGTAKYISSKGYKATSIVSGFDFDGRVKSLDKLILAKVLADKNNPRHIEELQHVIARSEATKQSKDRFDLQSRSRDDKKGEAEPFDAVVVELYQLDKKNFPESMDIGGMTLVRAAIKNFENVALAYDAESIKELVEHLKSNQGSSLLGFRKAQAKKAVNFIAQRCNLEAQLWK